MRPLLRWTVRVGVILLAGLGVAVWVAGYLTRRSDDYLGYSSRWGAVVTEWGRNIEGARVCVFLLPPFGEGDGTESYIAGAPDGWDGSAKPCGWFLTHGSEHGNGPLWGLLYYNHEFRRPPKDIAWEDVDFGEGKYVRHGRVFLIRPWVLGSFFLVPAVMWLGVWMLHWWKRRRRLRRGLCVGCGYDFRASAGRCPECGWEIPGKPGAICGGA